MRIFKAALATAAVLLSFASAKATSVDLSAFVNSDLTTYTRGDLYPQTGGSVTIGAQTFQLTTGPNGQTHVILLTQATLSSVLIPVGVFGVASAHTLINSAFGTDQVAIGSLDFLGSLGATFTYNLVEGDNVRDHYQGAFVNSAPNIVGSALFTDQTDEVRLDMQSILLPAAFLSQTLVSITFNGVNLDLHEPFLAALNVDGTVPVPGALPLFATGLGALALLARRRRKQAAA